MSSPLYAVPGCRVERVRRQDGAMLLIVRADASGASRPSCRRRSTAPHSTYVRRFYCQNARCTRRTFAEPLRGLIEPRAQRTRRLAAAR